MRLTSQSSFIMSKYYYKRSHSKKGVLRLVGLGIFLIGFFVSLYIFFPLLSWQLYFAQSFASQNISAPIPKTSLVNDQTFSNLLTTATKNIGVDYTNAENWYPSVPRKKGSIKLATYSLSIPKLGITNAVVSTSDDDLSHHLVNFNATVIPPENGNSVIFGHSTLPQLFDASNYKTIFANAYKLSVGDKFFVTRNNVTYAYKIKSTLVTDPDDTSIFAQTDDTSYVTLVTCTPPGTVWRRLAIKAALEKI